MQRAKNISVLFFLIIKAAFVCVAEVASLQVEKLSILPPEAAVREYYYIAEGNRANIDAALGSLRRNPQLQSSYEAKVHRHSNVASDWATLQQLVDDLVAIRTEWSVRLLARMLFDDRNVELPKGISFEDLATLDGSSLQTTPFRERAAAAFQMLDLNGAPYRRRDNSTGGSVSMLKRVEIWREWWKANESAIPSLLTKDFCATRSDTMESIRAIEPAASSGTEKLGSIKARDSQRPNYVLMICWLLFGMSTIAVARKLVAWRARSQ
jgi:hypothetical protein